MIALCGKCSDCGHVFVVAHLPMELAKAAKLAMAAACPKCAKNKILVASQADLPVSVAVPS